MFFLVKYLAKLGVLLCNIAEFLKYLELNEEYYVYVPEGTKPRVVHHNFKSAKKEALRLLGLKNVRQVEVLQVIKRFEDEIPF